jgi:hypothetical protein
MASGGRIATGFGSGFPVIQNENGDWVYHPTGTRYMTAQEQASANAAERQRRAEQNAAATGGVALLPYGGGTSTGSGGSGSGSYGGGSGSGGYGSPGGVTGNPGSVVNSPGYGGGSLNLSRDTYEEQQMLKMRAQLNDEAFSKRLAALQSAGVGSTQPRIGSGNIAANEEAARAAAFARAKDRAGQTALSSLTALQNVLNSRGLFGSTEEARLSQGAMQGGANVINEFTRDELMTDLNRAAEISDRNYAGDITQRGQDAAAKQSLLALINQASAGLY